MTRNSYQPDNYRTSFQVLSDITAGLPSDILLPQAPIGRKFYALLWPVLKQLKAQAAVVERFDCPDYQGVQLTLSQSIESQAIRIHFFKRAVTTDTLYAKLGQQQSKELQADYLGFATIEHINKSIGTTLLVPPCLVEESVHSSKRHHLAIVRERCTLGAHTLYASGFPYRIQDHQLSRCAQKSVWELCRYYSTRYSQYPFVSISDIQQAVKKLDNSRTIPEERGLSAQQTVEVLSQFKRKCWSYHKSSLKSADQWQRLMYMAIESGLPFFAATDEHAVSIIGHRLGKEMPGISADGHCRWTSELCDALIINDDNRPPYAPITRSRENNTINWDDIQHIIIPYPGEVQAPIFQAMLILEQWFEIEFEQFPQTNKDERNALILRPFLTTSRSFRARLNQRRDLPDDLKKIYSVLSAAVCSPILPWKTRPGHRPPQLREAASAAAVA
jgi:hypothetical protein